MTADFLRTRTENTLVLCQTIYEWCEFVARMQHPETKLELARERDEMALELLRRVGLNYDQFGMYFR